MDTGTTGMYEKPAWQVKKIDPGLKRLRQNARFKNWVKPKTAITVLHELYPGLVFKMDEIASTKTIIYRVHFEINGKHFSGDGFSKSIAKQTACENAIKFLLLEKLSKDEELEKKCLADEKNVLNAVENASHKIPVDDFPWGKMAGFAIQKLVESTLGTSLGNHPDYNTSPENKSLSSNHGDGTGQNIKQEIATSRPNPTQSIIFHTYPRKAFPTNPLEYNPIALFNQTWPAAEISFEMKCNNNKPEHFATLTLDGYRFSTAATNKKQAKTNLTKAVLSTLRTVKYPDGYQAHVSRVQ